MALELQQDLIALGYDADTTRVTVAGSTSPYTFDITWGGTDVGEAIPLVECTTSMPAKFTAVAQSTGQVPFIADMDPTDQPNTTYQQVPIQSVTPLGGQFLVNTTTTNNQTMPSVAMDGNGDFTIAWQSEGQGLSFFNNIEARASTATATGWAANFMVDTVDNTTINFAPYVGMSDDGMIAISWSNTADPNYLLDGTVSTDVFAKVYNAQGAMLVDQFSVNGGGDSTVAFDSADDFAVSWEMLTTQDNIQSSPQSDVFAQEYQLYDATGALNFQVIRAKFRLNSANTDTTVNDFWPNEQTGAQVAMDADGDIVASYSGFGPMFRTRTSRKQKSTTSCRMSPTRRNR